MSASNESLLRDWVGAGDAGRLDDFATYLDPDVVVHAPLGLSTRGVDAERAVWKQALDAFPDIHHEIQEVISVGSTVAARVVVSGTQQGEFAGIAPTGKTFTVDQAIFAHVRDGKIVELWEIVDGASFREQLEPPRNA
jgi:predicted ester cyclase